MIFQSEKMQLETVRTVMTGSVNDVYVCRTIGREDAAFYTVLVIKQHDTVRDFIESYEKAELDVKESCVDLFSQDGQFIAVYPYANPRSLMQFYMGDSLELKECEDICTNLIVNCFSSGLPYPMLYLVLKQNLLHIAKDNSVYFSYEFDLSELDPEIDEAKCTLACAEVILKLLSVKKAQKVMSYELIEMKLHREGYLKFTDLYKDLKITAVPSAKRGIIGRIKAFFRRNREVLFRLSIIVAIILAIIVILSVLTQAIFGDIPWLRLFVRSFTHIGTESLV